MQNNAALRLARGGPEQRALEAGEIDAVIDHAGSNVILLPAARRALREAARHDARPRTPAVAEAPIANRLLAALPRAEYRRLLPSLEPRTLRFSEALHEAGGAVRHVYFPVDCVISLVATVEEGQGLQVGLVGREGMIGIALGLGSKLSAVRAVVQSAGTALRMSAASFNQDLHHCPGLQRILSRYAHMELVEARQTIACNCFHPIEARLARWLLTISDRVMSSRFFLTQAGLSGMLGVRRATINEAAGPLQERNLIRYSRGSITILDRRRLQAASCSCYARLAGRHGTQRAPAA